MDVGSCVKKESLSFKTETKREARATLFQVLFLFLLELCSLSRVTLVESVCARETREQISGEDSFTISAHNNTKSKTPKLTKPHTVNHNAPK